MIFKFLIVDLLVYTNKKWYLYIFLGFCYLDRLYILVYGFLVFLKFCLGGLSVAFMLEKRDSIWINSVWILWSFCWILCINSPLCELWKVFSLKSWALFAQFLPILVFSKDSRELLCRILKLFLCIIPLLHNSGLQLGCLSLSELVSMQSIQ